jgi:hypothetical protein
VEIRSGVALASFSRISRISFIVLAPSPDRSA